MAHIASLRAVLPALADDVLGLVVNVTQPCLKWQRHIFRAATVVIGGGDEHIVFQCIECHQMRLLSIRTKRIVAGRSGASHKHAWWVSTRSRDLRIVHGVAMPRAVECHCGAIATIHPRT
jgi:hypothetical protein